MSVRMKDVARDLGLSVITVSKALRNRPDISTTTRLRVLRRCEELNYRPNLSARALVTGRTNMMGLVIPDLAHAFFSDLARGLAGVLRNEGITLLIASSEQHADLEKQIIDQLVSRRVDALLIASTQLQPETFHQLKREGIPHILLDRKFEGFPSHFVGVDDEYLGYLATKHLIEIGCRTIAHISTVKLSQVLGRLSGYKKALEEHGLSLGPEYVASTESVDGVGPAAGHSAAKELLQLTPRPDAIFCFNDLVAMGAMHAILESGLHIPADVALIGCGNLYLADYSLVPLSSVDQQSTAIGVRAGQLAVDLVNAQKSPRPKTILLEPKLIQRASTRR
jgi:LacI family transcriptional regulator, galactose operon repressor